MLLFKILAYFSPQHCSQGSLRGKTLIAGTPVQHLSRDAIERLLTGYHIEKDTAGHYASIFFNTPQSLE